MVPGTCAATVPATETNNAAKNGRFKHCDILTLLLQLGKRRHTAACVSEAHRHSGYVWLQVTGSKTVNRFGRGGAAINSGTLCRESARFFFTQTGTVKTRVVRLERGSNVAVWARSPPSCTAILDCWFWLRDRVVKGLSPIRNSPRKLAHTSPAPVGK